MSDAHDEYVANGNCPYVQNKTWCNGKADHLGDHWAVYLHPDGREQRVVLLSTRYREARDDDDLAGYPKLCTTCGGTGHVTSYGGVHGDYDTQCSDCNGAGER
jgi:hypothetical protein